MIFLIIIQNIKKDLDKNSNYQKYRNIGDILAANMHLLKQDMHEITLFDFYNEKEIVIKFSKEGGLMYDLKGQWSSFEILGILDVIKEQIKSDMVLIPKINNIVATNTNQEVSDNSLKQKLQDLIAGK